LKDQQIYLASPIPSATFDTRLAYVRADMLDSISPDATVSIAGIDRGGKDGPGGGLVLNMDGFAAGYAKLQAACGTTAQATTPSPPPTPPQKYELTRTATAQQKVRLDSIVPNCQMGPMTVSVLEQPQHGALTIENGKADPCNPDNAVVFYESSAGYAGPDSITLNVAYPFGIVATRHYSIEVK
jgi:hypothetical protein